MAENADTGQDEYAYYTEMIDAWVLSDDTFGHAPYDQRTPAHTPCPPNPRNVYQLERAMHGLNSLQLAHNAPILPPALDTVLEVLWQSQPSAVRAACRVLPPNGPELWGYDEGTASQVISEWALGPENDGRNVEFFAHLAFYDRDEERSARPKKRRDKGKGKAKPQDDEPPRYHVVWPILVADDYGQDWVTLIWTQTMRYENNVHFADIQEFYVVDPRLDARIYASNFQDFRDRRDRILRRFESLLANLDAYCVVRFASGVLVDDSYGRRLHSHWYSPEMPLAEHSSGERCYAVVKQWLWRLTHELFPHADVVDAATQAPSAVLRAVNPYFERISMLGICAWVAMASLSFDARVTIESLPEEHTFPVLVNGRKMTVCVNELGGVGQDPRMGRSMRKLDRKRDAARVAQAKAEAEWQRQQAAARQAAAYGNRANPAVGSEAAAMDLNTAAVHVAHVATHDVPQAQAQAPASCAEQAITQAPGLQPPAQPPTPATGLAAAAGQSFPVSGALPQDDDTRPSHCKASHQRLGANKDWVQTANPNPFESRPPPFPRGAGLEQRGPPKPSPQTMTPRLEVGPDGRHNPLGTHDAPASDKPVRGNKRPATDAQPDLGGSVPPQDKRPRSEVAGAEAAPSAAEPSRQPKDPFSPPSSGSGLFHTPAKRGLFMPPSSPTPAPPRRHGDDDVDEDAPCDAPAALKQGPWLGTTTATGAQDPPAANDTAATGPAYSHMDHLY